MHQVRTRIGMRASGNVVSRPGIGHGVKARGFWEARCVAPDGTERWTENWENLVVNSGLNHILDVVFASGTQVTTWYVGLMKTGIAVAAGDSLASHAGWAEFAAYTGSNRIAWTETRSGATIDNAASKAEFGINATTAVGGAFLCSIQARSGTGGTLYAGGAFASSRSVVSGDTLQVTATMTAADDGV